MSYGHPGPSAPTRMGPRMFGRAPRERVPVVAAPAIP